MEAAIGKGVQAVSNELKKPDVRSTKEGRQGALVLATACVAGVQGLGAGHQLNISALSRASGLTRGRIRNARSNIEEA